MSRLRKITCPVCEKVNELKIDQINDEGSIIIKIAMENGCKCKVATLVGIEIKTLPMPAEREIKAGLEHIIRKLLKDDGPEDPKDPKNGKKSSSLSTRLDKIITETDFNEVPKC